MSPRATWRGTLKISLVSCHVSVYPTTDKGKRISFRKINKETNTPVKQSWYDPETNNPVENWNIGKGYEVAKNECIPIEAEELATIKLESDRTIIIDKFVDSGTIDERWFDTTYFIAPNEKVSNEAFIVIREGMMAKEVIGIGTIMLTSREHPIMIIPYHKGLMGITLKYPDEVRNPDFYFGDIPDLKLPAGAVDLAGQIISSLHGNFEPEKFVDHYEEALAALINEKKAGHVITPKELPQPPKDTAFKDIFNLLKAAAENVKKDPKFEAVRTTLPQKTEDIPPTATKRIKKKVKL